MKMDSDTTELISEEFARFHTKIQNYVQVLLNKIVLLENELHECNIRYNELENQNNNLALELERKSKSLHELQLQFDELLKKYDELEMQNVNLKKDASKKGGIFNRWI